MSNLSIATKFIQQLRKNGDSVIPIAAKDTLSNCAITYIYDKQASKEDGKERAIEEFGTEVVWIAGIPLLKKLFNNTVYKFFNADSSFDTRNLRKDANGKLHRLETLLHNVKDPIQKQTLSNILNNENVQKLYKKLHISRFIFTTGIPLAALAGLIVYKQKSTQKDLEQKFIKKIELQNAVNNDIASKPAFGKFDTSKKNISFKGNPLASFLASYMYNPVKNMQILDGGITTTRLALARKGERFEVGFKELFQIALIYFLATPIQNGLEFLGNKFFKAPIKNEYSLLSHKNLKEFLNTPGLKESIDSFIDIKNPDEVLKYIFNNENSTLVEMLKISGKIPLQKGKNISNALGYINTKDVQISARNIRDLFEGMSKSKNVDKFLSKTKNLKGVSVIVNILIGATAIGVFQPMLNIVLRKKKNNGETTNPAIKKLETEMAQKFAFKG